MNKSIKIKILKLIKILKRTVIYLYMKNGTGIKEILKATK